MMQMITIEGNLTRDPEYATHNGNSVSRITVAVNDRNGVASYYRVSVWGKTGETVQKNLTKGARVLVVGDLSASTYVRSDNQTALSLDVSCVRIVFLSSGGKNYANNSQQQNNTNQKQGFQEQAEDELPF